MESKVKINTDLLADAITAVTNANQVAEDYNTCLDSFCVNDVNPKIASWNANFDALVKQHMKKLNTADYYVKTGEQDEYDRDKYEFSQELYNQAEAASKDAATEWLSGRIEVMREKRDAIVKDRIHIGEKIGYLKDCLDKLNTALTTFEEGSFDGQKARNLYYSEEISKMRADGATSEEIYDYIINGKDVDSIQTDDEGNSTTMVKGRGEDEGKTLDLNTAVAANYVSTVGTVTKVGAAASYCNNTGQDYTVFGQMADKIVSYQDQFVHQGIENNWFSATDENGKPTTVMEKAADTFKDIFGVDPTPETLKKMYEALADENGLTDDQIKAFGGITNAATACAAMGKTSTSTLSTAAAMENNPGLMRTDSLSFVENTAIVATDFNQSINKAIPSTSLMQEAISRIDESSIKPFTPQVSLPVTDNVPNAIKTSIDVSTIDSQAEEIYYSRTPDQIAADRANALAAVDKAFSGENVEEFKEVLKQGGFEDVDIDAIMENKEVAVTAYILASESKNLTDIANKIAVANGIDNFDTSFNNNLDRMSLENGLSQSKLMAEVDDDVVEARNDVKNARSKYNESAKKANEDIEEADEKRKEMEEIKKKIIDKSGEDTSKWDDDDVEAYNKAVDTYNKANKQANDSYAEAMNDKNALTEAENNLSEIQEKTTQEYMDNYNEYNTQQGNNGGTETTQTTNTDEGIVDINGNPDSTLSVDDIKIDDSGNATISKNAGTTEINGNPDSTLSVDDIKIDDSGNITFSENAGTTKNIGTKAITPTVEDGDSGTLTDNMISLDDNNDTLSSVVNDTTSFAEANSDGRSLTTDDLMSLFGENEDLSNIASTESSLDSVDLSSIVSDDRVLPDLVTNDGILGDSNFTELASVKNIDAGNGLVNFANNNLQNVTDKIDEFQNRGLSGFGNLDMSSGLSSIQSDAAYSMENNIDTNDDLANNDVAGAAVEAKEVEKHTDGVLVEKEDSTTSEISDDGRRLESVEID